MEFHMNLINKNNKKGFTIIEVVLVLAIAGLIFLMVFLALPALQRSQRDTQRKNDLSRLQAAINDYKSANRGKLPDSTKMGTVISDYVKAGGSTFLDPSTNADYTVTVKSGADTAMPGLGGIFFYPAAQCGDDGASVAGNSPVLRMKLESQNIAYCLQA